MALPLEVELLMGGVLVTSSCAQRPSVPALSWQGLYLLEEVSPGEGTVALQSAEEWGHRSAEALRGRALEGSMWPGPTWKGTSATFPILGL